MLKKEYMVGSQVGRKERRNKGTQGREFGGNILMERLYIEGRT
jgi:hypothetical protein